MDLSTLLNGVAAQEETSGEKKALPDGNYTVVVEKVEAKHNTVSDAKGLSLQLGVFGDKFNGYKIFDYLSLNGSEGQLKYSLPKLKKIGLLCGAENTEKWLGKSLSVRVSVDKRDVTRNIVWGYSECQSENAVNKPSVQVNSNLSANEIPF